MTQKMELILKGLRRDIVNTSYKSGSGHVPSALSILEPIFAVYSNWQIGDGKESDSFLLSKGHGSLALYVVLAFTGAISKRDLDEFCTADGLLGGHPDSTKVPGVVASTGSLGHGYPMAAGIAYGKKNLSSSAGRVFALLGDGECNEGSIWETALLVSHHNLSNLLTWVDYNHSGDRALGLGDLSAKWRAFGFQVVDVDGHNFEAVEEAINREYLSPAVIIANSTKGQGVSFMENNPAWHHTPMDKDAFERAMEALT
jgi:transketolase